MIRMKTEDAIRAGLIDPLIAEQQGLLPKKGKSSQLKGKSKGRKSPAPAQSLVKLNEIPGEGHLTVDPQGRVQQAFLRLKIMPVPKERPRVVTNQETGKSQAITPARTKAFHKEVHRVVDHVMIGRPLMRGPLRIDMIFRMPIPKSWPKWRKEAALDGIIRPTGRPDMDNLEKALLDAFNERLIEDDSLVIERDAEKKYAIEPGIDVKVDCLLAGDIHITREQADLLRKLSGITLNDV